FHAPSTPPISTLSLHDALPIFLAVEQNLPAGEREAAGDQVEQRRLAGAVRPDDGVAFAPGHIQADATDDRRDAERLVDVPQCERAHHRPPSLAAAGWAAAWKASASCGPHLRPSSRLPASSTSAISQGQTLFELNGT